MHGRVAAMVAGVTGAAVGAVWSIGLGAGPAAGCPAPGEGRTRCVMEQVWLAGLTRVLLCGIAAALLVRALQAAPGWLRARRDGELVAPSAPRTPDDELLVAACWGHRYAQDGETVVRRAPRLQWDRPSSAGRGAEPSVQQLRRLLADVR